jgi:hypothetical protein
LNWIDRQFQWKERSARDYMAVAEAFRHVRADLPMTHEAMRLLAGPSVPEEVRSEATERAEAGERITIKEAERTSWSKASANR